jgi:phage protein U
MSEKDQTNQAKVDASTFTHAGKGKDASWSKTPEAAGKIMLGSMDDTSLFVEAQFNPKELEIKKSVPWSKVNEANKSNQNSDQGQGVKLEFTGAEGRSLTLEFLFDGAEPEQTGRCVDVAEQVKKLEDLASVRDPKKPKEEFKRPHRCMVVWGSVIRMSCVIESVSTKYTMFDRAGKPLRATCTVTLKEADSLATKGAKKGGGKGGGKK